MIKGSLASAEKHERTCCSFRAITKQYSGKQEEREDILKEARMCATG